MRYRTCAKRSTSTGRPSRCSQRIMRRTHRRSPGSISTSARPRSMPDPTRSRRTSFPRRSWIFRASRVDFRYTEEQEALSDTLQRFIARDYGFERRRELARSPLGFSEHAWQTYAELGLLALPFPKDLGGLEGDGVDVMLVM